MIIDASLSISVRAAICIKPYYHSKASDLDNRHFQRVELLKNTQTDASLESKARA
jgi:hypothetical protein